jgi:hypothetical protein
MRLEAWHAKARVIDMIEAPWKPHWQIAFAIATTRALVAGNAAPVHLRMVRWLHTWHAEWHAALDQLA